MNPQEETTGLPVARATIEQIVQYRNLAIMERMKGFDFELQADRRYAASDNWLALAGYRISEEEQTAGYKPVKQETDQEQNERRASYLAEHTKRIDRGIWKHIADATRLERLMDKQERERFHTSLANDDVPEVTEENIEATLERLLQDADEIFKRGIANVFSKLDRRFRSHDGFKIGSRIVITLAFNPEWGGWNYNASAEDKLRDIERTFCVLDKAAQPDRTSSIITRISEASRAARGGQFEHESEYFLIRGFKNGNAHIWFKRKDLVRKVNRLLADYYGEVIAEGPDVADTSEMGPSYHVTPAKNFGFFETSEAVADRLFDRIGVGGDCRILEPSAGRGALIKKAIARGADRKNITAVEIDPERAHITALQGVRTIKADFLTLQPEQLGQFDVIFMNPPFDRGRDCDHVRHALKFLRPGGVLAAIMSASTEFATDTRRTSFRALIEKEFEGVGWDRRKYHDLPPGSFAHAGTMVNTIILTVRRPV